MIEKELVYVIEDPTGTSHTLTYAEFQEFVQSGQDFTSWNKAGGRQANQQKQTALERIIDDGDFDYTEDQKVGSLGWRAGRDPGRKETAYGGDYRVGNQGAKTARWTFKQLPPGRYDVFVTWPPPAVEHRMLPTRFTTARKRRSNSRSINDNPPMTGGLRVTSGNAWARSALNPQR